MVIGCLPVKPPPPPHPSNLCCLPRRMKRLESVTGPGGHAVGGQLSLADVSLYIFLTQVSPS